MSKKISILIVVGSKVGTSQSGHEKSTNPERQLITLSVFFSLFLSTKLTNKGLRLAQIWFSCRRHPYCCTYFSYHQADVYNIYMRTVLQVKSRGVLPDSNPSPSTQTVTHRPTIFTRLHSVTTYVASTTTAVVTVLLQYHIPRMYIYV